MHFVLLVIIFGLCKVIFRSNVRNQFCFGFQVLMLTEQNPFDVWVDVVVDTNIREFAVVFVPQYDAVIVVANKCAVIDGKAHSAHYVYVYDYYDIVLHDTLIQVPLAYGEEISGLFVTEADISNDGSLSLLVHGYIRIVHDKFVAKYLTSSIVLFVANILLHVISDNGSHMCIDVDSVFDCVM